MAARIGNTTLKQSDLTPKQITEHQGDMLPVSGFQYDEASLYLGCNPEKTEEKMFCNTEKGVLEIVIIKQIATRIGCY